jgi:hypothetical protein
VTEGSFIEFFLSKGIKHLNAPKEIICTPEQGNRLNSAVIKPVDQLILLSVGSPTITTARIKK